MNAPKKEAFEIAGNYKDPAGTSLVGKTSGVNLGRNTVATPVVLWRDRLLTVDLYKMPGAPMYAVLYCPICANRAAAEGRQPHALRITQDNKKMGFTPGAIPRIPGFTSQELVHYLGAPSIESISGKLSIEPFACTWEASPEEKTNKNSHIIGLTRCNWHVAIDNNIAKDL